MPCSQGETGKRERAVWSEKSGKGGSDDEGGLGDVFTHQKNEITQGRRPHEKLNTNKSTNKQASKQTDKEAGRRNRVEKRGGRVRKRVKQ